MEKEVYGCAVAHRGSPRLPCRSSGLEVVMCLPSCRMAKTRPGTTKKINRRGTMMRAYEYQHTVGFEETNLAGNVYYANHIRWQGRCREMFLKQHAPDVLRQLSEGLCLITTRCSCEYLAELTAFDEIVIRMRLSAIAQNRVTMALEYWPRTNESDEWIARGDEHAVCVRLTGTRQYPAPLP